MKLSPFFEEVVADFDSWGLPGIVSILFKCSSQDTNLFAFDVKVQGFKDPLKEFFLPVLVHIDHCLPVVGDLIETFHLCEVSQRQDILLEAAASEPHTTIQEFIADSAIARNTSFDLLYIGLVLFAKDRDAVDGAYPLS